MPVQSEDKVPKERDFVFFTKRKRSGKIEAEKGRRAEKCLGRGRRRANK